MNKKELLMISITVFLTALAWVLIEIYTIRTSTKRDEQLNPTQVATYSFDEKVFEILNNKTP